MNKDDSNTNGKSFNFNIHRQKAVESYQKIRPLYEAFANIIRVLISEALRAASIKVASIEVRAKDLESFGIKSSIPLESDPNKPKYSDPLNEITDLTGARIITFFPRTVSEVDAILKNEFDIIEKADKSDLLVKNDKLGYQSIHYLVKLKSNRLLLPEYSTYKNIKAEIQVRTVLQHAWAEIEHDIQYKSIETIPTPIRRRFMALAGVYIS